MDLRTPGTTTTAFFIQALSFVTHWSGDVVAYADSGISVYTGVIFLFNNPTLNGTGGGLGNSIGVLMQYPFSVATVVTNTGGRGVNGVYNTMTQKVPLSGMSVPMNGAIARNGRLWHMAGVSWVQSLNFFD